MSSQFELIGDLTNIEVIAVNLSIRELQRLKDTFGGRRWRKLRVLASFGFPMEKSVGLKFTGMKPTELVGVK